MFETALDCKSFKMCDMPQAGIKPAGLPLWGTVVCSPPDNTTLLEFTSRVYFNTKISSILKMNFSALHPRPALPGERPPNIPCIKQNALEFSTGLDARSFCNPDDLVLP